MTITMYPGSGKATAGTVDSKPLCKVDTVCNAVRQALLELGEDRHVGCSAALVCEGFLVGLCCP